ncbi:MAG: hypothetical protein AAGJ80_09830, partial [Cyanobacteria bacterium J06553_1]
SGSADVEVVKLRDVIQLLQITAVFARLDDDGRRIFYELDHTCEDEWYSLETKFYSKVDKEKKGRILKQGSLVLAADTEIDEAQEVLYSNYSKNKKFSGNQTRQKGPSGNDQESQEDERDRCFVCKKLGHWKSDCAKRKARAARKGKGHRSSGKKNERDKGATPKPAA